MNERADWLAWSLQFLFGLVVGALFSLLFIRGGRRSIPLIAGETSPTFILGAALIGAALASHYGDQLWLGDSYRVIPPDKPRHSPASLRASLVVGSIGGFLVLIALARSFGLLT
jgi:predicted membrane protein